jgi:hypothetical protein
MRAKNLILIYTCLLGVPACGMEMSIEEYQQQEIYHSKEKVGKWFEKNGSSVPERQSMEDDDSTYMTFFKVGRILTQEEAKQLVNIDDDELLESANSFREDDERYKEKLLNSSTNSQSDGQSASSQNDSVEAIKIITPRKMTWKKSCLICAASTCIVWSCIAFLLVSE